MEPEAETSLKRFKRRRTVTCSRSNDPIPCNDLISVHISTSNQTCESRSRSSWRIRRVPLLKRGSVLVFPQVRRASGMRSAFLPRGKFLLHWDAHRPLALLQSYTHANMCLQHLSSFVKLDHLEFVTLCMRYNRALWKNQQWFSLVACHKWLFTAALSYATRCVRCFKRVSEALGLGMVWLSRTEMRWEGKSCMEMRHALACTRFWCLCGFELLLQEEINPRRKRQILFGKKMQ